jgi:glycine/D-amino acid oxidase-like deaminating enzyme
MRVPSVAVVGAGIVGAALAHAAAAAGAEVTLVEAAAPGAGTSGTSLAWINSNQKLPRAYHDLSVRAMRAWRRLAADLGRPGWYVPTGNLTWAVDDDQRMALDATVARLREWGYPVTEPHARAVAGLEPRLRVPAGAHIAYFPDEAFIHPAEAIHALVARAGAGGARHVAGAGPAVFEVDESRVSGVRLGDGQRIRADVYVCCVGARTPHLLEPLGVRVPLVPGDEPGSAAPGLVAHVATAGPVLARVVHAPDLSVRPTSPAGLRMDAEDLNHRVDTGTSTADLDRYARELHDRARRVLTGLPAGAQVEARLCVRPLPVDGKPIVGWLPAHDNVYLVVGHSGVTLAALLAELTVAEVVAGRDEPDLGQYRLSRFSPRAGSDP